MIENKEKSTTEKALDKFSDEMLNSAINGINEAVAIKQKEVDYWKKKAHILAHKYGQCFIHAKDKDWNFEEYISKSVECHSCSAEEWKNFAK